MLANCHELCPAVRSSVVQHNLQILETTGDLAHRVRTLVCVRVDGVERCTHGLGNLPNLREKGVAVRKDDEDVLAGLLACGSINEGLRDVCVVHV